MSDADLPLVSVVFVTYNRPHTLVATYETFLFTTDYPRERLELIVADDGSDPDVQALVKRLDFDVFCLSVVNRGLGANMNTGLRAAHGEFILLLQDDWICMSYPGYLRDAVAALRACPDVGMVVLDAWSGAITQEVRRLGNIDLRVLTAVSPDSGLRGRTYTDWPHVKRRDFHDIVGWYLEGAPMTVTENAMTDAVGRQDRYKAAILEGGAPFTHIGDRYSFNPGRRISRLETLVSAAPLGRVAIALARRLRRALRRWTGREGM